MTGLVDDPDLAHTTAQVEKFTGKGTRGDTFAAAVPRSVIVDDGRRLVRDAGGDQVVSETTLYDALDQAPLYAVQSKVTIGTRTSRVIAAKRRELGDPDVDHVEIALT